MPHGKRGKHKWTGRPWEPHKALTDMTDEELDELEHQVALARERGDLPKIKEEEK